MTVGTLCSIQVGLPRQHLDVARVRDEQAREWVSGIYKQPVTGPVRLRKLNLDGDGQADLRHHGGPDRAILAYCADCYSDWREWLNLPHLAYGAFGENFTVSGMDENTVCIGDVYQVGAVVLEVSQPRKPCWKLGRRLGIAELPAQVERIGRTGWYLRVLQEGEVDAGLSVVLTERKHPEFTVTRAHAIFRARKTDTRAALALASCEALSQDWREMLTTLP